jgi:hypothetical protein
VVRVVTLSGGYGRADACQRLAHNHGMIASFSRALLGELRSSMSDAAFNAALAQAIDEIYTASTAKVWPVSPRPAVTVAKPFRRARRSRLSVGQGMHHAIRTCVERLIEGSDIIASRTSLLAAAIAT